MPEILGALPRMVEQAAPEDLPALAGRLREAELAAEFRLRSLATGGNSQAIATQPEPLLTCSEGAKLLGVSQSYVETLVRQGKLPHVRLPATDKAGRSRDGRLVRLCVSDLRAWAEEHRG